MKAHLRKVRMSPKKASIVAGLVRNKPVAEAITLLKFVPNKSAAPLEKCVKSAVANAENNMGKDPNTLYVESVVVNKGTSFRRFKPAPRGRAMRLRKPVSHLTVTLGEMTSAGTTMKTTTKKNAKAKTKTPKADTLKKVTEKVEKETKAKAETKKTTSKTKKD